MSIDNSVDALLSGGGTTAKFPTIGTTIKGTVVSATSQQQTDFATREPKFWTDGKPMMELVITLETAERDPDDANDDGNRRLYVKGKMLEALRAALAGRKLEAGGTLAVKYTGDGEAKAGMNPPKVYKAEYQPPTATAVDTESLI